MILTKGDLIRYLEADKIANGFKSKRPRLLGDEIWRFLLALRKIAGGGRLYWHIIYHIWSLLLGYSIPINVVGEGLRLFHRGTIVISRFAKIGKYASIHVDVNIGQNKSRDETPIIGDNCFISPGAKLFGKIVIGNNVTIGANSVVNKSFIENNITVAGIPARIIKHKQVII